jgi:hypothetical protein
MKPAPPFGQSVIAALPLLGGVLLTACWFFWMSCAQAPVALEEIRVERFSPAPAGYKDSIKGLAARVDIQTGFADEPVTIYVDNKRVYSNKVTTNQATGFADSREFTWTQPQIQLRIQVGSDRREWRCVVNLEEGLYLGILQVDRRIHVLQSAGPFGYM